MSLFAPAQPERRFLGATPAPGRVVARIAVGRMPHTMTLSRDGAWAYTANMEDNTISVISTARRDVVATIPVGKAPSSIAVVGP